MPLSQVPEPVLAALERATIGGGTEVAPALRLGIQELEELGGDRVLAIFGDGDLGPIEPALAAARDAAERGIRIVVRGPGRGSAHSLSRIATDPADTADNAVIEAGGKIEEGIAGMARALVAKRAAGRSTPTTRTRHEP